MITEPKSFRTEAVVLKRTNVFEADRIVTLFTQRKGKIQCLAKGIRRPTSRKAAHLELFDYTTVFCVKGKKMDIVTQAEIIEPFTNLKNNLKLTKAAYHLVELVDSLTGELQENLNVFRLLVNGLKLIESQKYILVRQVTEFEKNLLQELGFGLPNHESSDAIRKHIESIVEKKLRSVNIFKQV
jgi:DNA repair protein RecO (recombination protein O)